MAALPSTYKRRSGADDLGREYELKLTTLLALRCATMDDTAEMWMASNADQVGDFDDIVLCRQTSDGRSTAYLIQVKHQETPVDIKPSDFLRALDGEEAESPKKPQAEQPASATSKESSGSGKKKRNRKAKAPRANIKPDPNLKSSAHKQAAKPVKKSKLNFSLSKYQKGFFELKANLENAEADDFEVIKHLAGVTRIVLVLFTNKGVAKECDFIEVYESGALQFLSTRTKDVEKHIYRFNVTKLEYDADFLDRLVLFCNEIHVSEVDKLIEDEFKRVLGMKKLGKLNIKSISDSFQNFVENWIKGFEIKSESSKERCCWVLTKGDVINEVMETLLSFYKLDFSQEPYIFYECPQRMIWNEVTEGVDVAVVKSEERIIQFLKQYLGSEMKRYYSDNSKKWNDHLSKASEMSFFQNHNLNTFLLKLASTERKITKFDVYMCLWYNKKVPLLLQADDDEQVQIIMKLLKVSNYNHRVVIITSNDHERLNERGLRSLNYFTNMQNLCDDHKGKILNCNVKLQGRKFIQMKNIIDPSMYNCITCNDIIDILTDNYNIGNEYESLPDYFIPQNLVNLEIPEKNKFDFDQLIQMSAGDLAGTAYVINANPGMGKSILMDYISLNVPRDTWVLKIKLNLYEDYYDNPGSNHTEYFNDAILQEYGCGNRELAKRVFTKMAKTKRVLLLFDGFDEIATNQKGEVSDVLFDLQREGFRMFITTRPFLQPYLQKHLDAASLDLLPFTYADQTNFLIRFFTKGQGLTDSNREIAKGFVVKLLAAARVNLNDRDREFTGIPLQTKLLAEAFEKDFEKTVASGNIILNEKFDLLYLYEEFIRKKLDILCEKYGKDSKRTRKAFETHQQLFAVDRMFNKSFLEDLHIDKKLEDYLGEEEYKRLFLQREGIVTLDRRSKVNFVHRTFGELLAAQWLAKEISKANDKTRKVIKKLCNERFRFYNFYKFLFKMFDLILTKRHTLHTAVVHENIDTAKELISSEPQLLNKTDDGGRTVFHLIALYGYHHDNLKPIPSFEDQMANILDVIPNDTITNLKDKVASCSALDYAMLRKSFAVANKMCENSESLTINFCLNQRTIDAYEFPYDIYVQLYTNDIKPFVNVDTPYQALLKMCVRYFISQDLLFDHLKGEELCETYCRRFFERDEVGTYAKSFNAVTVSELFREDGDYNDVRFAAALGTEENLSRLLSENAELASERDIYDNLALHYAVMHGRLENARILLAAGSEVNSRGLNGNTALHFAVVHCQYRMVEFLLLQNLDLEAQNDSGNTPLMAALTQRNKISALMLLAKDANANGCPNTEGDSPLHVAVEKCPPEVVAALMLKGADRNKRNKLDETPFLLAIRLTRYVAEVMLPYVKDVSCTDQNGNNALHLAAKYNYYSIIPQLLDMNNDLLNKRNKDGHTPLYLALLRSHDESVSLLISRGAEMPNEPLRDNIIHSAAKRGKKDIVELCLKTNVDINTPNDAGEVPLILALEENYVDTAELLLDKGVDLDVEDKDGKNALCVAAAGGHYNIVDKILQKGISVNSTNRDGESPILLALSNGHASVAKLLLSRGADCNLKDKSDILPLHLAARFGLVDVVRDMLTMNSEMNVNAVTQFGFTALHFAIMFPTEFKTEREVQNQIDTVQCLLDRSADVNAQTEAGYTLLQYLDGVKIESLKFENPVCVEMFRKFRNAVTEVLQNKSAGGSTSQQATK